MSVRQQAAANAERVGGRATKARASECSHDFFLLMIRCVYHKKATPDHGDGQARLVNGMLNERYKSLRGCELPPPVLRTTN